MNGACSPHEAAINAYKMLIGMTQGKRTLGRHTRKWEKIETENVWRVWIHLA
jgi:hypothetical protein